MQYKEMQARYANKCANKECDTEIQVGDPIFYSREAGGAFCVQCGQAKFKPQAFQPKPTPTSAKATVLVAAVMPYTFSPGCYCALVGSPCGWCVAQAALAEDVSKAKTITA